ncbi:hypothetical protein BDO18943_04899 [Burkholderia dolosa]|nr:hypothetical protein BDO18943_04899 [Burkholderia dolosa]
MPVDSDRDSELDAAPTPNSRANAGSSGCTQYSSENVENPARNNANAIRLYAAEPGDTPAGSASGAAGCGARAADDETEGEDMGALDVQRDTGSFAHGNAYVQYMKATEVICFGTGSSVDRTHREVV